MQEKADTLIKYIDSKIEVEAAHLLKCYSSKEPNAYIINYMFMKLVIELLNKLIHKY